MQYFRRYDLIAALSGVLAPPPRAAVPGLPSGLWAVALSCVGSALPPGHRAWAGLPKCDRTPVLSENRSFARLAALRENRCVGVCVLVVPNVVTVRQPRRGGPCARPGRPRPRPERGPGSAVAGLARLEGRPRPRPRTGPWDFADARPGWGRGRAGF